MILSSVLLVIGFVILIKGADFLVSGASSVAKRFNVSDLAIGLTVVAFGTSTPELLVNLMSATKGYDDAAFGNVIGSSSFNLLFILGVTGLIHPIVVQRSTFSYEIPFSLIVAIVLFLLVNDSLLFNSEVNILTQVDAVILLICFVLFLLYISRTMKSDPAVDEASKIVPLSIWKAILLIIAGLAMLIGGGSLAVDHAVIIARHFGLSERFIGLTILAIGTSLPELATSLVAAYKKSPDIAIGNVVGSNIFNITLILGATGVIHPTIYNPSMNFDLYVLSGSTVLLLIFMVTLKKRQLDRWEALVLLLIYVAYTVNLIMEK
jgi:cation:H+ antiporter